MVSLEDKLPDGIIHAVKCDGCGYPVLGEWYGTTTIKFHRLCFKREFMWVDADRFRHET